MQPGKQNSVMKALGYDGPVSLQAALRQWYFQGHKARARARGRAGARVAYLPMRCTCTMAYFHMRCTCTIVHAYTHVL